MYLCQSQDAQGMLSVTMLSEVEWDLSKKCLKNITLYRAFSKWICSSPSQREAGCSWEPQPLPLRHSSESAPGREVTTATLTPILAEACVLIHFGTSGGRAAFGSPHCTEASSRPGIPPSWVIQNQCCSFSPGSSFMRDRKRGDNFMPVSLDQNISLR